MPDAYLDHAATTPMRPEAVAAVSEVNAVAFGNPSGAHRWARAARRLLDDARDVVAEAVGARPSEVVFTSGGTEADNLAIRGVAGATGLRPLCTAVEHHAVIRPVEASGGALVAVAPDGTVDLDALRAELANGPAGVVSVMLANNETGTLNDLAVVAETIAETSPGTVLHTDAVAAAAWLDLPARCAPASLVTVSGHKVGGPKGIGALVVRDGTPFEATLLGGGQEHERRSGTQNVAGAVGFAAALRATVSEREATVARVETMRQRLVRAAREAVPGLVVVSPDEPDRRTAGTVLFGVPGVAREALVFMLDRAGVGASWGSSCASGATEPSHVLAAVGIDRAVAEGALRISLGWCSTDAEVDHFIAVLPGVIADLRREVA
ncbi:MAG: cysteine desulfurase [Acidimicrobiales bacterium]|nr:cysteine desulfurase [Acidimicrobiales bacterium]